MTARPFEQQQSSAEPEVQSSTLGHLPARADGTGLQVLSYTAIHHIPTDQHALTESLTEHLLDQPGLHFRSVVTNLEGQTKYYLVANNAQHLQGLQRVFRAHHLGTVRPAWLSALHDPQAFTSLNISADELTTAGIASQLIGLLETLPLHFIFILDAQLDQSGCFGGYTMHLMLKAQAGVNLQRLIQRVKPFMSTFFSFKPRKAPVAHADLWHLPEHRQKRHPASAANIADMVPFPG